MSDARTSNLVSEMEAWIRDRGNIYACGRDYPGSWRPHDATCACCLLIAAVRALNHPAVETKPPRTDEFAVWECSGCFSIIRDLAATACIYCLLNRGGVKTSGSGETP